MKLQIRHETRYRYRVPVALQPHRLMMTPRSGHELALLESHIELPAGATLIWSQDVAGNMIGTASFDRPVAELLIVGTALVEQSAPAWPILAIEPGAHVYPFAYMPDDAADLGQLAVPAETDPAGAVARWAAGFVMQPATDTLSMLKDLNAGVLDYVTYRVRDEEGTQSPRETLSLRSGSCRDIAALFIEAARGLGFGARAVSGYLYDPDLTAEDGGSTHAWAEVFLPGAGWIAFDPTHRRMGSAQLVGVAVGRSNRQIMPISGAYVGSRDAFIDMAVNVTVLAAH